MVGYGFMLGYATGQRNFHFSLQPKATFHHTSTASKWHAAYVECKNLLQGGGQGSGRARRVGKQSACGRAGGKGREHVRVGKLLGGVAAQAQLSFPTLMPGSEERPSSLADWLAGWLAGTLALNFLLS